MVIGVIVGVISLFYAYLINVFSYSLFLNHIFDKKYLIIIPALGGLLVGLLIKYGSLTAKGHGIPAILDSIKTKDVRLSARDLLVEGLASAITIGTGGSAGRFGPVVEIGAGIGDILAYNFNFTLNDYQTLLGSGAAAGIAAIFNAPLAGIMFVCEVLFKKIEFTRLSSIIISALTANMIVHVLYGNKALFYFPQFTVNNHLEYLLYLILGLFVSIIAILFIKIFKHITNFFDNLKIPLILKPALGGLIVGIAVYFVPEVSGTGINVISNILKGKYVLGTLIIITLLKVMITSITLGSGGSGGVFAPAIFIGTASGMMMGKIYQNIFTQIANPSSYALVGMIAVFTAISHAPLTGILILLEMTRNYHLIVPILMVVITSSLVTKKSKIKSVYSPELFKRY